MAFQFLKVAALSGSWRILPMVVIGVHVMPLALTMVRGASHQSAFVRTTMIPMALDKLPASAFGDWE
jgi:hypothetical protein